MQDKDKTMNTTRPSGSGAQRLTLKSVREELGKLGLTITPGAWNDYRVRFKGDEDDKRDYHAGDLQDALDTGRAMADEQTIKERAAAKITRMDDTDDAVVEAGQYLYNQMTDWKRFKKDSEWAHLLAEYHRWATIDQTVGCNVRGRLDHILTLLKKHKPKDAAIEVRKLMIYFPDEAKR